MSETRLPGPDDFPAGTLFVIKEFDVPLVQMPDGRWFNWFGGYPSPYDPKFLRVDNNQDADSFGQWLEVLRDSLPAK